MIIDKIDKYLAGEMTTEERASFEKEMEHDAKLREDVRIIAFIIHGIKQVGLEEDNQRLQRLIASSPVRMVGMTSALWLPLTPTV
ncbi:MAG: hypothetical protein IIT85_01535 [Prevotella sp.]|nr:hypothetical protein [Prevotella sp.]